MRVDDFLHIKIDINILGFVKRIEYKEDYFYGAVQAGIY